MALKLTTLTLFGSAALLLGACVVTSTPTDNDGEGGTNTTTTTDGGGGAGGEVGGSGGIGGATGGSGGGTGGATCVDETGSGTTDEACEAMNITPPPNGGAMTCNPPDYEDNPLGYDVCLRGYEIYTGGQFEDLQACLALIGVEDACEETPVTDCLQTMYDNACDRDYIQQTCEDWASACDPDPLDVDQCANELGPMGDGGMAELVDCMNNADPGLTCQEAYDECFETVSSF